ncbi:MAG: ribonuclease D [Salinisphaera sp.]|jgi:ribonuclease D|nr:ribonuclease D [Salinisphaera sp.]
MIPKPPEHVAVIRDVETLTAFCRRMRARAWVAIDTEFLRERTYYPKLCLVQIADHEEVGLIDVLIIDNLVSLAELLTDPNVTKVFHSAEQDLEVLHHTFGTIPAPVFDTQVAAPLAGFDDQMGYARLIDALLDVQLDKAHTRTDWSRRPLPDGALDYAADDVRYLVVAYTSLRQRLTDSGRLDWLTEDFARMTTPGRFDIDTQAAWRRLKAWHRMAPAEQQVLAELAAWREQQAIADDRPRRWILADDAVMTLARLQPVDRAALDQIHDLPSKTVARYADVLLERISAGQARAPEALADHGGPPDGPAKRQIKAGVHRLNACADALGVEPSAIASRQEVAALVRGERNGRLLHGWRAEIAGLAILAEIERLQGPAVTERG